MSPAIPRENFLSAMHIPDMYSYYDFGILIFMIQDHNRQYFATSLGNTLWGVVSMWFFLGVVSMWLSFECCEHVVVF